MGGIERKILHVPFMFCVKPFCGDGGVRSHGPKLQRPGAYSRVGAVREKVPLCIQHKYRKIEERRKEKGIKG